MATLTVKGKEYTVPPITLGQLRGGLLDKMRESDKLLADNNWLDAVLKRGEIVTQAMKARYPELEESDILESLDIPNTNEAFMALLGASGITPKGEVPAAT